MHPDRYAVGDEVYGLTDWYRDGSAAEFVVVEARDLALKPATLTHTDAPAAAMPIAASTSAGIRWRRPASRLCCKNPVR